MSTCAAFAYASIGGNDLVYLTPYPWGWSPGQPCPADGFVLMDQTEAQQLIDASQGGGSSSETLPSPEDAAAAWGIGFVMVVGCYVIARSVGAVVNFINRD